MPPTVSIIIPAYNVERFIGATLESILAQTFSDWECVVVNDGSRDKTWPALQEYAGRDARLRIFDSQNRGVAAARNFGFSQTNPASSFVIFMDSDDVYRPEALATLLAACQNHPEFVGAHGLADMIDPEGKPIAPGGFAGFLRQRLTVRNGRIVPLETTAPTDFRALIIKSPYPPGLVMVRREAAEKIGPMDGTFTPLEDRDYWIRAARVGDLAMVDQVILYYRRHDGNATGNYVKSHAMDRLLRYQTFHSSLNTREQQKLMREYYRAWQLMKLGEKRQQLIDAIREGNVREMVRMPAHLVGHAIRYVRGSPTTGG